MNEDTSKLENGCPTGRKRSRSQSEDPEECLPIAKRINNLQIRSRECSSDGGIQDNSNGAVESWNADLIASQPKENGFHSHLGVAAQYTNNNNSMYLGNVVQPVAGGSAQVDHPEAYQRQELNDTVPVRLKTFLDDLKSDGDMDPYEPELDDSTNPHYYSINQLLYYANFARQTRSRNGFKQ